MADLAKLILPRVFPKAYAPSTTSSSGLGADVSAPLDPVVDAASQLGPLQAYFAVIAAGGSPTAGQLADAQRALGALGADLRALQAQPSPPTGSQVWISGPAAIGVAGASAAIGGVLGWWAKAAQRSK